jgi:hypothetical protein
MDEQDICASLIAGCGSSILPQPAIRVFGAMPTGGVRGRADEASDEASGPDESWTDHKRQILLYTLRILIQRSALARDTRFGV